MFINDKEARILLHSRLHDKLDDKSDDNGEKTVPDDVKWLDLSFDMRSSAILIILGQTMNL